jgi:hypothetical protein
MLQALQNGCKPSPCQAKNRRKCVMPQIPLSAVDLYFSADVNPQLTTRQFQIPRSSMMAFFSPKTITWGFQNFAFGALTSVKLMMVTRSPGFPK